MEPAITSITEEGCCISDCLCELDPGVQVHVPRHRNHMNNQMDDFASPITSAQRAPPSPPNNYTFPGKRPSSSNLSTTVAWMIRSWSYLVAGASGGTRLSQPCSGFVGCTLSGRMLRRLSTTVDGITSCSMNLCLSKTAPTIFRLKLMR